MLVRCALSTLFQSGVQTLGVLGDTLFHVSDHSLVVFALTVHAGLLVFQTGSSTAAIVGSLNLASGQSSSTLLHHGLCPGLQTVALCHLAARSSTDDRGRRAGVRLGILQPEQLELSICNSPFALAHMACKLWKLV